MIGAFAYLTARSTRNLYALRLKRLRNPRYVVALLLGLSYFYFLFWRTSARDPRTFSPYDAPPVVASIFAAAIALYVAWTWIFGADRNALAFTEAEVSMLFTAPVSRRGLLLYKLMRGQAQVLATSLAWFVIFHRPGVGFDRVVATWVFLSTLSMHRLGVALIRASHGAHGTRGLRRSWVPVTVFVIVTGVVLKAVLEAWPGISGAGNARSAFHLVEALITAPPVSWVLLPFRIPLAPIFAPTISLWLQAMLPALLLLALHFLWVIRTDTAFEEAAVEASAYRAQRLALLRSKGVSQVNLTARGARRTLPLKPAGAPGMAIVWKNTLWLMRAGSLRTVLGYPAVFAAAAIFFAGRSPAIEMIVVIMCSILSVGMLLLGPVIMRNDLRGELARLPMLKTMPLPGRDIVFAEVSSSAVAIALMQLAMVSIAILTMPYAEDALFTRPVAFAALAGAPLFLLGLNMVNFAIHNALALLLPGWVRVGDASQARVETMGTAMLSTLLVLIMLAILLVIPAAITAVIVLMLHWPLPFAVAAAGLLGGASLVGEAYLLAAPLGARLERMEPSEVG